MRNVVLGVVMAGLLSVPLGAQSMNRGYTCYEGWSRAVTAAWDRGLPYYIWGSIQASFFAGFCTIDGRAIY